MNNLFIDKFFVKLKREKAVYIMLLSCRTFRNHFLN